jgi:DNA-binding transcriptional LysR family regulator
VMDFKHLRAFLAVARTSSFTAAALELHYSQSTITEQVQGLESELGSQLFDRSGRRPVLTAAGQQLLGYAEQLLELSDRARAAVRSAEPEVVLTLGGLETISAHLVPELLTRFQQEVPQARVVVRQGTRGEIFDGIRQDTIDAGLTFGPPADPKLSTRVLQEVNLMVVAPPGHPLSRVGELCRADLVGAQFLATEKGCGFREMYDTAFAGPDVAGPVLVAEVGSMAALRGCVASGMGLALLPDMVVADQLERGEVAALTLRDEPGLPPRSTTINLTWRHRAEPAVGLTRFLAMIDREQPDAYRPRPDLAVPVAL